MKLLGTNTKTFGVLIESIRRKSPCVSGTTWECPWRPGVKLGQKLFQAFVLSIKTFHLHNNFLKKFV